MCYGPNSAKLPGDPIPAPEGLAPPSWDPPTRTPPAASPHSPPIRNPQGNFPTVPPGFQFPLTPTPEAQTGNYLRRVQPYFPPQTKLPGDPIPASEGWDIPSWDPPTRTPAASPNSPPIRNPQQNFPTVPPGFQFPTQPPTTSPHSPPIRNPHGNFPTSPIVTFPPSYSLPPGDNPGFQGLPQYGVPIRQLPNGTWVPTNPWHPFKN